MFLNLCEIIKNLSFQVSKMMFQVFLLFFMILYIIIKLQKADAESVINKGMII